MTKRNRDAIVNSMVAAIAEMRAQPNFSGWDDVAPFSDANTEFIALAHNMMPTLLEAIDLLETVGSARACQDHEFDVDAWFVQVRALLEKLK